MNDFLRCPTTNSYYNENTMKGNKQYSIKRSK